MKRITLSKRLSAIARFVPPGARVADVGTDHGFIPVFLAQTGLARRIIASDIRPGPLSRAEESARAHGVTDAVEFVLAPGLSGVGPADVDTVIIAGMGGETILSILADAAWTRERGVLLILQPQSKLGLLYNWLLSQGYDILDMDVVEEKRKRYTIMVAKGLEDGDDSGL